mgnify:CR=1 FL=1
MKIKCLLEQTPLESLLLSNGVNPHLFEYLLYLFFSHEPFMPENFPVLSVKKNLGRNEANPVDPGQLPLIIDFDDFYDYPTFVFLCKFL